MFSLFDDKPIFAIAVWFLYLFALFLNIASLFPMMIIRNLLKHETYFVTLILAIISISGCAFTIMSFFQTGDSISFVSFLSLAMPVTYNLVLPGVITRGFSRLNPDYRKPCSCRFFYTLTCIVLLVYYVMIVSSFPILMITRNIRVARSVDQDSNRSRSIASLPVLHFTGAICQISTVILCVGEIKNFSGKFFPCFMKQSQEIDSSRDYMKLPAAKYLIYWSFATLILISLSALARCFELYFSDYLLWFIVYTRVLSDCCLFMTQPIALIILHRVCLTNGADQPVDGRNLHPRDNTPQNQSAVVGNPYLNSNNGMMTTAAPHYSNQQHQYNYAQAMDPSGQLPPVPSYEYATSNPYPSPYAYYYPPPISTNPNTIPSSQVATQFYPQAQVQYKVQ